MFVLAAVLAILLGVLAVLQYRWVGQLSADERDRIKDHLKDSADEFAEDFNRELTRAFFWLQVGPVIPRRRRRSRTCCATSAGTRPPNRRS